MTDPHAPSPFDPSTFERPAPQLFTYYILGGLLSGPFILFLLPALWFRYSTLRYRFEESGLRMQVGLLFRKETVTAYRRIQDIHVTSNVFQRWLGIASISVQTASGSALPEIVLEGITEPEKLRDWLYGKLRGAQLGKGGDAITRSSGDAQQSHAPLDHQVAGLLTEIRDHLATIAARSERGDA